MGADSASSPSALGKRKQRSSSWSSPYGYTTASTPASASTSTFRPHGVPFPGNGSWRAGSSTNPIVLDDDDDDAAPAPGPTPKKAKGVVEGEKRLRQFRPQAPQTFHPVYERALSQRFYVLGRSRCGTEACPEEFVELTGSTGNVYVVHVAQQPSCTCPHSEKGHQCKHVLYVLARVLGARYELVYQLALLSEELREIFAAAPPIPGEGEDEAGGAHSDPKRKPLGGNCPICFGELKADAKGTGDDVVFCRATCGNNIHRECFAMWAATKRQSPGARDQVTCPMCRSPWQGDDDTVKRIRNTGVVGAEGYVNVASQLGISTVRDTSSYYSGFYRPEGYSYGGRRRRGRKYPT